jgi:small subunit ribosomal protein S27Ae
MTKMSEIYQIKDGKIDRKKEECPRCGPGVFMAEHENRTSCGKCGYTVFTKKE